MVHQELLMKRLTNNTVINEEIRRCLRRVNTLVAEHGEGLYVSGWTRTWTPEDGVLWEFSAPQVSKPRDPHAEL